MSEQQTRDNSGAVWDAHGWSGNARIQGADCYCDLVTTNAKGDVAPAAFLYIRSKTKFHPVAMFKPNKEAKYVLSGKNDDLRLRVFAYKAKQTDNIRSPSYTLSFLDYDNQEPQKPQEEESQETPF